MGTGVSLTTSMGDRMSTAALDHGHDAQSASQAYEAEAARWMAAGHPGHAASFYAAALDHQPRDTRVRMMLAGCLVRCNQPAAGAAEYLRVALAYAEQRRHQEALAIAYQVLRLDAAQLVYMAVADALRSIGRPARDLCARAAAAHLAVGRVVDGLHMLQLGAEIDARNPDVRRQLAQLYLSQHMKGEAVANLAVAGRLLLSAGNNAEYVAVAEQLLAVDPRHLETLRELPRVYLRVGEPQRAVVRLADLMRVSPGDAVGHEILAHAFVAIDRVPTALSMLERLVGQLVASGRATEASALLERAQSWRLDDPAYASAVAAVGTPKPAAPRPPVPRRTTQEGTVVLDITDLLGTEPASPPRAPAPPAAAEAVEVLSDDDVLELDAVELAADADELDLVALTQELCLRDLWKSSREPRRAPARPAAPLPRRAATPREGTNVIDLADVDLDEDTLVRRVDLGRVASMVLDEDSSELQAPAPARRARAYA